MTLAVKARDLSRAFRTHIGFDRRTRKTVLLPMHYTFEADELCDRIAVIRRGEIVAEGTAAQLKDRVSGGSLLEVETYGLSDGGVAAVRQLPGVASAVVERPGQVQQFVVQVDTGAEVIREVLRRLGDVRVGRVSHRESTFEDAYIELVNAAPVA
jgi:ABC-2 type transport system ATP-binding protein